MHRRRLLQGGALLGGLNLLGLAGCATSATLAAPQAGRAPGLPAYDVFPTLAPVRADMDRIFDITVCTRPFRAQGPRLDTEMIGDTLVVHNYGHGGSGWSLSWGSSTVAVSKGMANSPRDVAVVGCGALGITSAILAQQAGAQVTIYARDLLPHTRSARATGSWTPDSRIALTDKMDAGFPALWEEMARTSFKTYRSYLGLPGNPVQFTDRYSLSDDDGGGGRRALEAGELDFAHLVDRIRDINPHFDDMPPGSTPFPTAHVQRSSQMQFNIADYAHTLMSDFLQAGGKFVRAEFHAPGELAALKEKVVINCPGYAARSLWKDESIAPVRGQIAWLIPQPEVNYGIYYHGVSVLPRSDGIVIQGVAGGDMRGYGIEDETPDRAEAEDALKRVQELYARPGWRRG
jgi:D-amino-acid oxidase